LVEEVALRPSRNHGDGRGLVGVVFETGARAPDRRVRAAGLADWPSEFYGAAQYIGALGCSDGPLGRVMKESLTACRRIPLLASLTALVLAVSLAAVGVADASSSGHTRFGGNRLAPGLVETRFANGAQAGWASNTYIAQHSRFASRHGLQSLVRKIGAMTPQALTPSVNKLGVTPDSHAGCHGNVCIDVEGKLLVVNSWTTHLLGNYGCVYAMYFRNDNLVDESNWTCPDSGEPGVYWSKRAGGPWTYPDGTWLCNAWHDEVHQFGWYPCAEVHN
jgi:hypothetical protein